MRKDSRYSQKLQKIKKIRSELPLALANGSELVYVDFG